MQGCFRHTGQSASSKLAGQRCSLGLSPASVVLVFGASPPVPLLARARATATGTRTSVRSAARAWLGRNVAASTVLSSPPQPPHPNSPSPFFPSPSPTPPFLSSRDASQQHGRAHGIRETAVTCWLLTARTQNKAVTPLWSRSGRWRSRDSWRRRARSPRPQVRTSSSPHVLDQLLLSKLVEPWQHRARPCACGWTAAST